jgi:hypothetical protein
MQEKEDICIYVEDDQRPAWLASSCMADCFYWATAQTGTTDDRIGLTEPAGCRLERGD